MKNANTPISIEQAPLENRMGVHYAPFRFTFEKPEAFDGFLEALPPSSRRYYRLTNMDAPKPFVEVVLPGDYHNSFDLSDVKGTLQEMHAHSLHHRQITTATNLSALHRAVG